MTQTALFDLIAAVPSWRQNIREHVPIVKRELSSIRKVDPEFIARLRELVVEAGSVAKLERLSGMKKQTLKPYLTRSEPTRHVLVDLARGAHVNLDWLVNGEGPKRSGDAVRKSPPFSLELLRIVVEGVEKGLAAKQMKFGAAEKARFVALAYERYAEEPQRATVQKVVELVRSAA